MLRQLTQRQYAILAAVDTPEFAVSLNGVVARVSKVMTLVLCGVCEEWRPPAHRCREAEVRASLLETLQDIRPWVPVEVLRARLNNTPREDES